MLSFPSSIGWCFTSAEQNLNYMFMFKDMVIGIYCQQYFYIKKNRQLYLWRKAENQMSLANFIT